MKIRNLMACVALLLGMTGSAMAQDAMADEPSGGDMAAPEGGDATAAPAADMSTDSMSTEKKLSAALLLGYGLTLNDSKTGGLNVYGLGFGVRGGYKVTPDIYVGAKFAYFLGDSIDIPSPLGGTFSASINEIQLGIEGGYDLKVADKMVIRPRVGLGLGITSASSGSGSTDLYLELGGELHYDVSDDIYVGGDLALPLLFSNSTLIGLTIEATAGMRF